MPGNNPRRPSRRYPMLAAVVRERRRLVFREASTGPFEDGERQSSAYFEMLDSVRAEK